MKYRTQLNSNLIKRQGLTNKEVESLLDLHESRLDIEEAMKMTDDPKDLKALFEDWTMCQFELQKGWGFTEDASFHLFWTVPKCECPRMDNEDRYPTGSYIYVLSCPVHGQERQLGAPASLAAPYQNGATKRIKDVYAYVASKLFRRKK